MLSSAQQNTEYSLQTIFRVAFHAFIHPFEGAEGGRKGLSWRGVCVWIRTRQVHVLGRMYNRARAASRTSEGRRSVGASDIAKTD